MADTAPKESAESPPQHKARDFYDIIGEAGKFTILVIFALYAIGFVIWHSYLATFGVSGVEFLQTEYLAAAFCYLFLCVPLAVPPAMIVGAFMQREPLDVTKKVFIVFSIVWYWLLQESFALYFPDVARSLYLQIFLTTVLCLALLHYLVVSSFGSRHLSESKTWNFLLSRFWIGFYPMAITILSLYGRPSVSTSFVFDCLLAFPVIMTATGISGKTFIDALKAYHPIIRFLAPVFVCLLLVNNIKSFGAKQFGLIPRAVGGGKPEMALIRFSENDPGLALFLSDGKTTNATRTFGPVAILLRTEKEVFFIDSKDFVSGTNSAAKQIRADLIQGINYSN